MTLPVKPYLPNTGVAVNEPTGSVNLGANADTMLFDVSTRNIVGINIQGTFTATLTWTVSIDGVTFFQINPYNTQGSMSAAGSTGTTNQQLFFNVAAVNVLKLAITAYTSGTINLTWQSVEESVGLLTNIGQLSPGSSPTNLGKAEDAVAVTGDTGVFVLGVRVDSSSASTTSASGDYSQVSTDNVGAVRVVGSMGANGATGHTQFRLASAASTNATSVKATPGCVYGISVANSNATVRYLKFYNKASAPTVGTDTPVLVIAVPPTNTLFFEMALTPLPCSAGIALATTTGATDADATAVGAADLLITLLYA